MFLLFYLSHSLLLSKIDTKLTVIGQGVLTKSDFNSEYEQLLKGFGVNVLNITSLELDDRIHTVEAGALDRIFLYLKEAYLPSLVSLSDEVFGLSFKNLENITFGPRIVYIGANFMGTTNLTLNISASVERIHPKTIQSVKSFILDKENTNYAVCDDQDNRYLLYPNKSTIYAISDSYNKRTSVRFPDCITSLFEVPASDIKYYFDEIDFNKVERIESKFFDDTDTTTVTQLDLKNIQYLGPRSLNAFTKVTDPINISNALESIDPTALLPHHTFRNGGNSKISQETIGNHKFIMRKGSNTLLQYLPTNENIGSDITIPSKYSLQSGLFRDHLLGHITIDGMNTVNSKAFDGCSFTRVTFNEGVKRIEDYAFSNNIVDSQIIIDFCSTIEYIGNAAFKNTKIIINDIKLPSSLKEIGNETFMNSYSSSAISLPKALTKIGDSAFEGCTELSAITFGESSTLDDAKANMITYYGMNAFKDTSVYVFPLGSKVTYIGSGAFADTISFIGDVAYGQGVIVDGSNSSVVYVNKIGVLPLEYIYPNVTSLDRYTFKDVNATEAVFSFTGIQTIGVGTFENFTANTLILGPQLVTIPESAFRNAVIQHLTFQTTQIKRIYKYGLYGLSTTNLTLPKFDKLGIDSIFINVLQHTLFILPSVKIDFGSYNVTVQKDGIETNLTFGGQVIPKNKYISCSFTNHVLFSSSVRTIQYGCLDNFGGSSVILEEGVQSIEPFALDSLTVSQITFPSTMKNINPSCIPVSLLNVPFGSTPWENIKFVSNTYKFDNYIILSGDQNVQMCQIRVDDEEVIQFH